MFGSKTIDFGSSYLSFPSYAGGNYVKFTAPVGGLYQLELMRLSSHIMVETGVQLVGK